MRVGQLAVQPLEQLALHAGILDDRLDHGVDAVEMPNSVV